MAASLLGAAGRFVAANAIGGLASGVGGAVTERLILEFREDGARVVKTAIDDIGASSETAEGQVIGFQDALLGIAGAAIAGSFLEIAQAATLIDNRLVLATGSVEGANAAFERLRDISLATRSSLESNVDLFQKLSSAGAELGATQDELFRFVQATGTALAIQGQGAAQNAAAILQLSQAVGSPTVQAQEFNPLLDTGREILAAAARGIPEARGSVNELRALVKEQQITGAELFRGVISQLDGLEERFQRTAPTITQAFSVIRTGAIALARDLQAGVPITGILAQGLLKVAENIELVAAAGAGVAVLGGAIGLGSLLENIGTIASFVGERPLLTLAAGATAGAVALGLLRDEINLGVDDVTTLGDVFRVIGDDVRGFFESFRTEGGFLEALRTQSEPLLNNLRERLGEVFALALDVAQGIAGVFNTAVDIGRFLPFVSPVFNLLKPLTQGIVDGLEALPGVAERAFDGVRSTITKAFEDGKISVTGFLELFGEALDGLSTLARGTFGGLKEVFGNLGRDLGAEFVDNFVRAITSSPIAGPIASFLVDQIPKNELGQTVAARFQAGFRNATEGPLPDLTPAILGLPGPVQVPLRAPEILGERGVQVPLRPPEDQEVEAAFSFVEFFRSLIERAQQVARDRVSAQAPPPAETGGERRDQVASFTKEETTALDRLRNRLDPQREAVEELREGLGLLNRAEATETITAEQRLQLSERLRESLRDQLNPIGAITRELEKQSTLAGLGTREADIQAQLFDIEDRLRRSGKTDAEAKAGAQGFESTVVAIRDLNELKRTAEAVTEGLAEAERSLSLTLIAQSEDLASGGRNAELFARAVDDARLRVLAFDRSAGAGAERGLIQLSRELGDAGANVERALTGSFGRIEDALTDLFSGAKVSVRQFGAEIAAELTRAFIVRPLLNTAIGGIEKLFGLGGGSQQDAQAQGAEKIAEASEKLQRSSATFLASALAGAAAIKAAASALDAASAGGGGGGGGGDAAGAIATFAGGSGGGGSSTGSTISTVGSVIQVIGSVASLFGARDGADFVVGGNGGIDSQLVAFRASPDERVRVTRPDQERGFGGTTTINNVTNNVTQNFRGGAATRRGARESQRQALSGLEDLASVR